MARFDAPAVSDGGQGAGSNVETSTILSHEGNGAPGAPAATRDRGHSAHAGNDHAKHPNPSFLPHEIGPTTTGIDVSEFQNNINWTQVQQSGVKFAYIRATDGTTIQDADFQQNWKGAEQAGIPVGAYHYFTTTSPVQSQIDNFVSTIKKVDSGNLPPVIDVEDPSQFAKYTVPQRVAMIQQMLDGVQKEDGGVQPMLYMSSDFSVSELNSAPQFDKYKLWVADYTTASQPDVPQPWTNWNFWQHTDSGTVPGIAGGVDMDYFNGTVDQLPVIKPVQPPASP